MKRFELTTIDGNFPEVTGESDIYLWDNVKRRNVAIIPCKLVTSCHDCKCISGYVAQEDEHVYLKTAVDDAYELMDAMNRLVRVAP